MAEATRGCDLPATPTSASVAKADRRLGVAWVLLCLALAVHVADEALTGFLSVYNPTVAEIGRRTGFHPPSFRFDEWLTGLILAVLVLLALSPLAFANWRVWRPLAYFFSAIMLLNGMGHTAGSIAGRTFADITFPRPMPGFYSSPLLLAASVYLLLQLRRSRR